MFKVLVIFAVVANATDSSEEAAIRREWLSKFHKHSGDDSEILKAGDPTELSKIVRQACSSQPPGILKVKLTFRQQVRVGECLNVWKLGFLMKQPNLRDGSSVGFSVVSEISIVPKDT